MNTVVFSNRVVVHMLHEYRLYYLLFQEKHLDLSYLILYIIKQNKIDTRLKKKLI